jgi:hypothetical protein
MQTLSPAMILDAWERGSSLQPVNRALLILECCCPEHTKDTLLDLSIGQRDALLFRVYRQAFGDALEAYTECPACGERLQFSLSCSQFLNDDAAAHVSEIIEVGGVQFSLRAPTTRDALLAASSATVEAAKAVFLSRCAVPATDFEGSIDTLPEHVQSAIAAHIAVLDPHAEMMTSLVCPSCGQKWDGIVEIVRFLWAEIRGRARRLLQAIDALARAYGWREADVLALSDTRRSIYVQMALA